MKFNDEINAENLHEVMRSKLVSELENVNKLSKFRSILKDFKKEHKFKACGKFTTQYWIQRGWSEEMALSLKKEFKRELPPGPMQVEFWQKKINPATDMNYTVAEAKYKIKTQRPVNKEYWIERGYTVDDAIEKIAKLQLSNGKKWVDKHTNDPRPDRTRTQLMYWVNKHNMSIQDAKLKLKKIQNNISIDAMIEKYGEIEGKIQYDKVCNKISFAGTVDGYINRYGPVLGPELHKEKTIKSCTNNRVSKESLKFFIPIYKFFRRHGIKKEDIYWGISGSTEFFLHEKYNSKIFWYDFTIPKLNLIIEFHGTRYHPNPTWSKYRWSKWDLFGVSADEKRSYDLFKKTVAENKGYTLLEIWSEDKEKFDNSVLSNFLNFSRTL